MSCLVMVYGLRKYSLTRAHNLKICGIIALVFYEGW